MALKTNFNSFFYHICESFWVLMISILYERQMTKCLMCDSLRSFIVMDEFFVIFTEHPTSAPSLKPSVRLTETPSEKPTRKLTGKNSCTAFETFNFADLAYLKETNTYQCVYLYYFVASKK